MAIFGDEVSAAQLGNNEFIANLRRLSTAGLLLESANPNPVLVADILKLTDLVPDLRIVIDHLPQAVPPAEPASRKTYEQDLQALGQRNVFVKGSEVLRQVGGKVRTDLDFYKPWLDQIWEIFGEDRLRNIGFYRYQTCTESSNRHRSATQSEMQRKSAAVP